MSIDMSIVDFLSRLKHLGIFFVEVIDWANKPGMEINNTGKGVII